jgi:methionyl-tRNA formyltransferase
MKIVFFGTPDFAVASLELLYRHGLDIVAVVTAPSRQAGRGLKVTDPAVKTFALTNNIEIFQPSNLKDPEFIGQLSSLQADLFVVVAFRKLPEMVWKMPRMGTFNLHASLLPKYRGAAPIQHAIIRGETETGVTTFFIGNEIDTGNVLMQRKLAIDPDETAGELHDRLMVTGAELVLETVRGIENQNIQPIPQEQLLNSKDELPLAPKLSHETGKINWDNDAQHIHNLIRGLSPYPAAYSWLKMGEHPSKYVKIIRSKLHSDPLNGTPGSVSIQGRSLLVTAGNGHLEILELQPEGKKRMSSAEFINGLKNSGSLIFTSGN